MKVSQSTSIYPKSQITFGNQDKLCKRAFQELSEEEILGAFKESDIIKDTFRVRDEDFLGEILDLRLFEKKVSTNKFFSKINQVLSEIFHNHFYIDPNYLYYQRSTPKSLSNPIEEIPNSFLSVKEKETSVVGNTINYILKENFKDELKTNERINIAADFLNELGQMFAEHDKSVSVYTKLAEACKKGSQTILSKLK